MRYLTLSMATLALLLTACGDPGAATGVAVDPPEGDWMLTEGSGPGGPIELVEGHIPTLSIEGQDWGGTVCNHYGGTAQIDGDQVTITELMQTEMGCLADGAMESEAAYLDAFRELTSFEVSGGRLVLTGPDIELTYDAVEPEPDAELQGTSWRLESIVEDAGRDGSVSSVLGPATLELDGRRLTGETGCNFFGGDYQLEGDRLRVVELSVTEAGCEEALAGQEQHVVDVLVSEPLVRIAGRTLELTADDGPGLIYRAD